MSAVGAHTPTTVYPGVRSNELAVRHVYHDDTPANRGVGKGWKIAAIVGAVVLGLLVLDQWSRSQPPTGVPGVPGVVQVPAPVQAPMQAPAGDGGNQVIIIN